MVHRPKRLSNLAKQTPDEVSHQECKANADKIKGLFYHTTSKT